MFFMDSDKESIAAGTTSVQLPVGLSSIWFFCISVSYLVLCVCVGMEFGCGDSAI